MSISNIEFETLNYSGKQAERYLEVTVDSYSSGGESFAEGEAGLARVEHVNAEVIDGTKAWANWDETNGVLLLYDETGELAAGTSVTLRVKAVGRQ